MDIVINAIPKIIIVINIHHLLPYKERFFSRLLPFLTQQPEESSVRSIIHIPPAGDCVPRQKIFIRKTLRYCFQKITRQFIGCLCCNSINHLHSRTVKYQHLTDPLCRTTMISYGRHFTTAIMSLCISVQVPIHFLPIGVLQAKMLQLIVPVPFQPIGISPGNIRTNLCRHFRSPFHTYPVSCQSSFGEI